MALYRKIPFLRIIVPLCAGIITALCIDLGSLAHVVTVAVLLISFTAVLLFSSWKNENTAFGIVFTFSLVALGNVMFSLQRKNVSELRHEEQLITCTLEDYPEKRETGYRVKAALHTSQINDSVAPIKGSMMLYIMSDSATLPFKPGDVLTIQCVPKRITNRGNPNGFDYRFYMENQGFKYLAFLTPDDITGSIGSGNMKLKYRALIVRENIIDMYRERGIEGRNLALVAAMTVGDKTMLEPDQKESFIKAGVMHIMAVSGLHAVILSMFIFKLLFFMKNKLNAVRIIIAIIFLWGFAFVTGLTPSVMRAALMFSFIQTGSLMKRPVNSMNSVLASAFVLILIKPSVIFDAGFLLSYSAVIFIIAFYKDLYMMFNAKTWLGDQIWQSAAVTLVAQAGVLPLTLMFFNRFPVYFLAANLVIVPLSSLIIIIGCIVPAVYPVTFLSEPLASVLNWLTSFAELLTVKAASFPGSSIEGIGMTVPECVMLTAIVSLSMYLITKKDGRVLNTILVFVLIMVVNNLFKAIVPTR